MSSTLVGDLAREQLQARWLQLENRVQLLFDQFWTIRYQPLIDEAINAYDSSVTIDFRPTQPQNVPIRLWERAIRSVLEKQNFTIGKPPSTVDPETQQVVNPATGILLLSWASVPIVI